MATGYGGSGISSAAIAEPQPGAPDTMDVIDADLAVAPHPDGSILDVWVVPGAVHSWPGDISSNRAYGPQTARCARCQTKDRFALRARLQTTDSFVARHTLENPVLRETWDVRRSLG